MNYLGSINTSLGGIAEAKSPIMRLSPKPRLVLGGIPKKVNYYRKSTIKLIDVNLNSLTWDLNQWYPPTSFSSESNFVELKGLVDFEFYRYEYSARGGAPNGYCIYCVKEDGTSFEIYTVTTPGDETNTSGTHIFSFYFGDSAKVKFQIRPYDGSWGGCYMVLYEQSLKMTGYVLYKK